VGVEDWFQVGAFQRLIEHDQWYRFETRVERNTLTVLELLDQHDARATFFVLGWVAERMPELVASIAARGHEIANRGYYHRSLKNLTREEFRDDLLRSQECLEAAAGQRVRGYRVADGWFGPGDLWALDVLSEEGYAYDSSLLPIGRQFAREPWRRFIHEHQAAHGTIREVPPSTAPLLGWNVPIAGGNWFRQLPHTLVKQAVRAWDRDCQSPFVMYFHAWELDPDQPRINAVDRLTRLRHYRNLDKMRWVLEDHLSSFRFGTIADSLGLPEPSAPLPRESNSLSTAPARTRISTTPDSQPAFTVAAPHTGATTPVSIVIPCYNEESSLPYLSRTLERLSFELADAWRPHFVFVDDCSRDATWDTMQALFAARTDCTLVRHEQNSGVSTAIRTGIRAAQTDIVCSMDCDCSYDPLELKRMLPLLVDGVDLVTASPYHPNGRVKNVPGWRLLLSKGLSQLYRLILPQTLHTWTSCFRVYRRTAVEHLDLREGGFLGTAELVGHLALRGSRIVEHPATLEVRIFGESKMKTCRTIVGHLRLIARLVMERARIRSSGTPDHSWNSPPEAESARHPGCATHSHS